IELIRLTEVDEDARLVAWINFDLSDRSAAFAEAHARFVAAEAASTGGQAPILELHRSFARRDWAAMRECVRNAGVRDYRPLVLDLSPGAAWVEPLRLLAALAPAVAAQTLRTPAWTRLGRVDVSRVGGTMPHGGGPFENIVVRVLVTAGDR